MRRLWLALVATVVAVACPARAADDPVAGLYVSAMCMDFAQIAAQAANPKAFITPDAQLQAVLGDFCACVSAHEPGALLKGYFAADDWEDVFDGVTGVSSHLKYTIDFATLYLEHYAPCAEHIDQASLEKYIFGAGFKPSCQDSDGGAVPGTAGALTGGGMPVRHFIKLAYDVSKSSFQGAGATGAPTDACLGGALLQETFCVGAVMSDADIVCKDGCQAGACVTVLPLGAECGGNSATCASGHCIDGVCCDRACDGLCEACTTAGTGRPDGTCGFVLTTRDPRDACAWEDPGTCGQDGTCDGAGACRLRVAGMECGPGRCNPAGDAIAAQCDGAGACVDAPSTSCGAGSCRNGACVSECESEADCAPGAFCVGGTCTAGLAPPMPRTASEPPPPPTLAEGSCQVGSGRRGASWAILGLLTAFSVAARAGRAAACSRRSPPPPRPGTPT